MTITDKMVEAALRQFWAIAHAGGHYSTAMRSALEEAEQAAWEPIEGAPKDGAPVLVYAPSYDGLPELVSMCAWHEDAGFCIDPFRMETHFRSLPKGPGQ